MKKILAVLLWLGGSVAFAQSVNNTLPVVQGIDGSNSTAAKVITFNQMQSTPGTTPTPQTSSWLQLNGNGAALVEFSANTLAGTYSVQVSNNPTPVSTPGTNIYTVVKSTSTYGSGGSNSETQNWSYMIKEGWRYMRLLFTPEAGNAGTLNAQVRLFGNPTAGDAQRTYTAGTPWYDSLVVNNAVSQAAATLYQDFTLPSEAKGFVLYQNVSAVSGASTITGTVYLKDVQSGQVVALTTGTASHATGFSSFEYAPGQGTTFGGFTATVTGSIPNHLVLGNTFTGTGNSTYTQTIVPLR